MSKKWITLLLGSIVIGTWSLVFVALSYQPQPEAPAVLPTLAMLPTTVPAQAILPGGDAADVEVVPDVAVPNQVVIQFAPDAEDNEKADYVDLVGGEIVDSIPALNAVVLSLPDAGRALVSSPLVVASEPDYYVSALIEVPTSDTYYDQQWGLEVIGAPQVWSTLPLDGPTFTVAVIDSGICASHPDLSGRIGAGYDFVEDDTTPQDVAGHGCAVSGVIAANIDNGIGIAGVAPNTQIMPLRVLDAQGIGTYSDVAAAIVYAVNQGASIINLSLGGPNSANILANAVNYAASHDVVVVAAAGNTGTAGVLYPAAYEPVIAVGAVDVSLQRSNFSTYGPEIDALAPGRDILTTRNDGGYDRFSGTSLAAPHVTGVAALEMARGKTLVLDGGLVSIGDAAQPPTPQPVTIPPEYEGLYNKAVDQELVRVIVSLNASFQPEGQLAEPQIQTQQADIVQAQQQVISNLSAYNATVVARSDTWRLPALALEVDADALEFLISSPDVMLIIEDVPVPPTLTESVPFIDADIVHGLGYTGNGQAVAILDTGVDGTHPFFSGRVVEEACFSSNVVSFGVFSLCPGGEEFQYGSGAASPVLCADADSCFHGTHVAGLTAGDLGVAPSASIIGFQVFSKFTFASDCSPFPAPCLLSFPSDQISALQYLDIYLRPNYDIAAANLSLGGGSPTTTHCDAINTIYKAAIDTLRSRDIATVIAAGNLGEFFNGISTPACISTAISVGSTDESDNISPFSQYAPILDLLAPGENILSSIPGGSFAEASGTSMATPHVAGAWALLKNAMPDASVDTIMAALENGGVPLFDSRNGVTTPRIDVDNALFQLLPSELIVNTTDDVDDGVCNVAHCSLRDAITVANSTNGIREVIQFDISGAAPFTIVPGASNPLPSITDSVIIDGTSQPGFVGIPIIEIDGSSVGASLDPTFIGLNVTAGGSIIKGLVVNNFAFAGISLSLGDNSIVAGNYIGTEPDGATSAPNGDGIRICQSSNNLIGGSNISERNVISGNADDGIDLCQAATSTRNVIRGNFIGVKANGSSGLGNGDDGIEIVDTTFTTVGGANTEARNIISGNVGHGVRITGSGTDDNLVQGNYIGTNASGSTFIGNGGYGVAIEAGAAGNTVGGFALSAAVARQELSFGNRIAGNGSGGIMVTGNSTRNDVYYNELFSNTGLGIDLGNDGVTENDSGDGDPGPNTLLNFPVLTGAVGSSNLVAVTWSYNSQPSSTYLLDFYTSSACDPSGNGEGEVYLGSLTIATDSSGNAGGTVGLSTPQVTAGTVVTATATDASNNVSEFSDCQPVTADSNVLVVNTTDDVRDGECGIHCSLADAIQVSNNMSGQQTIAFNIAGTAPFTIRPTSPLPTVANTILDATSQPGYAGSPVIELDGTKLTTGNGLTVQSDSTIRGFAIHSFDGYGISLLGNFNTVEANYIGTNPSGTIALPNDESGIEAAGNNNLIGGTTAAARNVISGNNFYGVYLGGNATKSHTNTVQGNYIGTNAAGTAALGNGRHGISVGNSDNVIGGSTGTTPGGSCTGACNLISGNGYNGIHIIDQIANPGIEADNNTIQGNAIGTNVTGTAALPNGESGIHLDIDTKFNLIGGSNAGEGNLISGNTQYGIEIDGGEETRSHQIVGNRIGTNSAGTGGLGNGLSGIFVTNISTQNTISDNLISGNGQNGIRIEGGEQNTVEGNMIGTNAAGTAALPNIAHGLLLENDADNNLIGGSTSAARNLISGNGGNGVHILASNANVVTGNFIGTNAAGNAALGNSGHGVAINQNNTNVIGGTTGPFPSGSCTDECNVISGNGGSGVFLTALANANDVIGNYIGTDVDGLVAIGNGAHGVEISGAINNNILSNIISGNSASGIYLSGSGSNTIQLNFIGAGNDVYTVQLPNSQHGIHLVNSANNNEIGDTDAPGLNVISYNTGDGIRIESGTGNGIYTNAILDNGGLGINLGTDNVTINDSGDGDSGANLRQNFPVINQVELTLTDITVDGTLNSAASTTYRVEVFWSETCDASGHGEGASYMGSTDVTTDGSGNGSFTLVSVDIPSTSFVTATATDPNGNTSEFSACVEAILYAAMPSNFAANVLSEIDIELTWTDESIDETHWMIERSLAGQNNWTQIASIATSDQAGTGGGESYHDSDFLCSQSYDYRLRGYNQPGDYYSLYTPVVNATPTCPELVAPGSFTATAISRSQIDLNWADTNTTETAYMIQHSVDGGLNWNTLVVLSPDTTSYSHMGLACVTTHHYRMRTVRDHAGPFSAYTAIAMATTDPCPAPVAPINPAVTALSRNQIQFSWAESAPAEVTNYHVERSGDGTTFSEITVVAGNVNIIVDSNLSCGTTYYYRVRTFRAEDSSYSPYSAPVVSTMTNACPVQVAHTVALYRDGVWQFWDVNQNTAPAITFAFGPRQSGWRPIVGDWDGDGVDGIGLYRDGVWMLRNATSAGPIDFTISFGQGVSGWQPIVGDWDGDGVDGIGLYKDGVFQLRQTASSGLPQMNFTFGQRESGWQPVAGDWNHSGNDSIGLYKNGLWLLSNSLPARSDVPPFTFGQTQPGWKALAGDWNKDGAVTIGVYKDRLWQLRNSNSTGSPDIGYRFSSGEGTWLPLASYRGDLGSLILPPVNPTATSTPTSTSLTPVTPTVGPSPTATNMPDVNIAPIAMAVVQNGVLGGGGYTITVGGGDTSGTVFLDGTGSYDPDGDPVAVDYLTYRWHRNLPDGAIEVLVDSEGTSINSAIPPGWVLPLGLHEIFLTVTDAEGAQDTDIVIVSIVALDPTDTPTETPTASATVTPEPTATPTATSTLATAEVTEEPPAS